MTDDTMALRELLQKGSEASLLREMIGFAAQRLMELETELLCGAAHGERSAERLNQRNGYTTRWDTIARRWVIDPLVITPRPSCIGNVGCLCPV